MKDISEILLLLAFICSSIGGLVMILCYRAYAIGLCFFAAAGLLFLCRQFSKKITKK